MKALLRLKKVVHCGAARSLSLMHAAVRRTHLWSAGILDEERCTCVPVRALSLYIICPRVICVLT